MFFTKALRSTATIAMNHATQTTTKTAVRSGRRVGEAWAVTEARRLGPTILMYGTFIVSVLGWPFLVRKADMDIGIHGMKQ
ncbi:Cox26 [Kluyveromyces lactis]|uniref:KLLA0F19371p n=1 Tax=Kluyveromyces lactis (strain ATCC 8585 / CBS 2359 / DSM 70799 / NBRC 1267 / NRRL Y-1140 / WM37) TaxID=284590 RepID=B5FVA6_KLULA|nr:uncharacterized protein KLLA0_F19371g [Kluyveromyces lactis]QEU62309.1 Cox26 [Kluyveromyces lactis]CAR64401.1 KLLA0F19371p [Kluyveromyces lactis]|eukprot:XP_002999435.1 uncharacterized protein KLLA0_F19371g [Kluyveromyces lactis]